MTLEPQAQQLEARAKLLHSLLGEKAQSLRATTVIRARKPDGTFVDVAAVGRHRNLDPVQRNALIPGAEIPVHPFPGRRFLEMVHRLFDAERKALGFIARQGWTPVGGGVAGQPICPTCRWIIRTLGGVVVGKKQFWFPGGIP